MQKYKIPLAFFFIASLIGLFLRWQFIDPTAGVNFKFFLHGHSHVMFTGWVFNLLLFAFIDQHIPSPGRGMRYLIAALQVFVIGMLIFFPIQGYARDSIIFSTLHTFGSIALIVLFFRQTRGQSGIALLYARIALLFFLISTLGPFMLGYLMANGLGQGNLYYYSIYYYLHFQYNGFFLFGVISLLYGLFDSKGISYDDGHARSACLVMAVSNIPAYLLSVLFSDPGIFFNIIGGVAAFAQLYGFFILFRQLRGLSPAIKANVSRISYFFLLIALLSLSLKFLLQLLSSDPAIAAIASQLRPVLIAYLHLVLLGVITTFLIVWMIEKEIINRNLASFALTMLVIGFVGSEVIQVILPWWSQLFEMKLMVALELIFMFSAVLVMASLVLVVSSFFKKH